LSEPIFVLVHGTWAARRWRKGPRWPELQARLREMFPDAIIDDAFTWRSRNMVSSRFAAAERFREHVARLARMHQGCQIYVLAHSHGGNVCLWALRDSSLWEAVSGVICMATPFLVVSTRGRLFEKYTKWNLQCAVHAYVFVILFCASYTRMIDFGERPMWWLLARIIHE
jgi:hypothetical protein